MPLGGVSSSDGAVPVFTVDQRTNDTTGGLFALADVPRDWNYISGGWIRPGGKLSRTIRPPACRTCGGESHPPPVYSGIFTRHHFHHDGRVLDQFQAEPDTTAPANPLSSIAGETFSQDEYTSWTVNQYTKTRLTATATYDDIPTGSTDGDSDGFIGTEGTHYDVTEYGYDDSGRRVWSETPGGTITHTFFESRGLVSETWVGTDDVPTYDQDGDWDTDSDDFRYYVDTYGTAPAGTNMVLVTENEYDDGSDGGDGLLTTVTQHVDSSNSRVTEYGYDWRGRRLWTYQDDGTHGTYSYQTYDRLGRVTKTDRYHDDDSDFATQGPETSSDDNLIARTETSYDDRGRVYETTRYAVDPDTGTVGNSLTDETWYDDAGNVIKSHAGGTEQFSKTVYDGLGRTTAQYVGFDTDESTYGEADDVDGDTIFSQTEFDYNDAGQTIFVTSRQRLNDATGAGTLNGPSGNQPKSRDSYTASWYDEVGRQTESANYGTNGGTAMDVDDRPDSPPSRSDTVLVTSTEYNTAGRAYKTTDPGGKEDRTTYDDRGRVTKTVENYTDGDPSTGSDDEDVTVETTYTADGQVSTYTAKNGDTGDQVTTYVYGSWVGGITPEIYRADLLRAVIYPDSDDTTSLGDGNDSTYDCVEYKYNRLGQTIWTKDQNETVHEYTYDDAGRQTADRATSLGTNIDGAVRRIDRAYEVRGMVSEITSYDATSSGNTVNEVVREYDDFGQLEKEYQEHSGAKDANTLYVQYNYAGTSDGLRLESIRYPNSRLVHYTYGSSGSDADNLNRLDAIKADSGGSSASSASSW